MGIVLAAMQFIEPLEGTVARTYVDPAGYATACSGNRSAAVPGATFTDEECQLLLLSDAIVHVIAVRKLVTVPLDDELWIALVSFSFNVGWQALASSTLLRKVNAGDREGAREEFARWVHAGGKVLPGLVVRRAREARLLG
ncbi:MAG: lysozyme [Steroidobacteraceae bacterium]|nr:lysozyme [Steroidobacteraceae bacterium]